MSHGFLHKGLRRSLLTPRSSFSFFCHTQGFSPTTERARVEPRSQRETQRPAWLPPRPRADCVPPACPPRAPRLVLLGTRASLLVLLTFLQEETSLHSSLTSVELIRNENHLSLTKTVTLDCAGGPRGRRRRAVPGSRADLSPDHAPSAPPPRVYGPAEPQTAVFADGCPLLTALLDG